MIKLSKNFTTFHNQFFQPEMTIAIVLFVIVRLSVVQYISVMKTCPTVSRAGRRVRGAGCWSCDIPTAPTGEASNSDETSTRTADGTTCGSAPVPKINKSREKKI